MSQPPNNQPDDTAASASQPQPPGTPRWVKITGVLIAMFVLVLLARVLLGGGVGGHGPGMHGGLGSLTPPSSPTTALAPAQPTLGS